MNAATMDKQALAVDVIVDAAAWSAVPGAEEIVRRSIAQAARAVGVGHGRSCELAVLLTDDVSIQKLNREWRGFDKPTNVLSFSAATNSISLAADGVPHQLGDIAIAFETTQREAEAEGKPLADHVAHLAVHGFLHLLGYDHESEPHAEAMEQLERAVLARLGVPDPYKTLETGV